MRSMRARGFFPLLHLPAYAIYLLARQACTWRLRCASRIAWLRLALERLRVIEYAER
jgi:hypothetical protein